MTEVWTEKSKMDYEELTQKFRVADLDGCGWKGPVSAAVNCMQRQAD